VEREEENPRSRMTLRRWRSIVTLLLVFVASEVASSICLFRMAVLAIPAATARGRCRGKGGVLLVQTVRRRCKKEVEETAHSARPSCGIAVAATKARNSSTATAGKRASRALRSLSREEVMSEVIQKQEVWMRVGRTPA
jgi:hypothetical protein